MIKRKNARGNFILIFYLMSVDDIIQVHPHCCTVQDRQSIDKNEDDQNGVNLNKNPWKCPNPGVG